MSTENMVTDDALISYVSEFVNILQKTRMQNFARWSIATIDKVFKWADYFLAHQFSENSQVLSEELPRTGIIEIDGDPHMILKDPLKALALALFTSPLLSMTGPVLPHSIKCFQGRIGKHATLDLCSKILTQSVLCKRKVENVLVSCSDSEKSFERCDDVAIVQFINNLIQNRVAGKLSENDLNIELNDLAANNRDIFVVLCRSVTLPFSVYFSELCRSSSFESSQYKFFESTLTSLIEHEIWEVIISRIKSDDNLLLLLEDMQMLDPLAIRNVKFAKVSYNKTKEFEQSIKLTKR
jgi:hypothetical protein